MTFQNEALAAAPLLAPSCPAQRAARLPRRERILLSDWDNRAADAGPVAKRAVWPKPVPHTLPADQRHKVKGWLFFGEGARGRNRPIQRERRWALELLRLAAPAREVPAQLWWRARLRASP